jgi:hypothetical protein
MRIWDLPPRRLCRQHLLGEHRELHAIWAIITQDKKGYAQHPETKRWRGKLRALYSRHGELVAEMTRRGYQHHTDLDARLARGHARQTEYVDSPAEQKRILRIKKCDCRV